MTAVPIRWPAARLWPGLVLPRAGSWALHCRPPPQFTHQKLSQAPTIVAGFWTRSADPNASDQELRITSAL